MYASVEGREHLPGRSLTTSAYYRLAAWASDGSITPNASDYRLLDRQSYQLINSIQEQNLFLRGLVNRQVFQVQQFRSHAVRGTRARRFRLRAALGFASRGILAQSAKPLRMITRMGAILSALSLIGLVVLTINAIFNSVPFAGFGTIVGLQVLFFGSTMSVLGLVSEYIALIYTEARPDLTSSSARKPEAVT